MNLAAEIHETNELLRAATAPPPKPAPPRELRLPIGPDPEPLQGSAFLWALAAHGRVNPLRDVFVAAGAQFYERDGRDAVVTCRCAAVFTLRLGELKTCDCGRFWFCGKNEVYAAAAIAEDEHVCEPERVELSNGQRVLGDSCGTCGAHLQPSSTIDPKEGQ